MPEYAADSAAVIARRVKEMALTRQHRCFQKNQLSTDACWCWKAGPTGETLPCTAACPEEDFS